MAGSGANSFLLSDVRNAAKLLQPSTTRLMPFAAYQVCCDVLRVRELRIFCGISKIPPMLTCCGSGCTLTTWQEVIVKSRELSRTNSYRRQHARLGLELCHEAYVEHSDCAERKFACDIEPEIPLLGSDEEVPNWEELVLAWERERSKTTYPIPAALENLRALK